jgi:chaperone required for assembly of F1-ATPase
MREFLDELSKGGEAIDPVEAARSSLRRKLPARFFRDATIGGTTGAFEVRLDGKPLRTPARRLLALPTRAAAELIAAEWSACGERIDPAAMPATRIANSAIDGVADDREGVVADLVRHAGTDLLCYRAGTPAGLVALQARHFDPVLEWMASRFGARLRVGDGVVPIGQPPEALEAVRRAVESAGGAMALACLHAMATLCSSTALALAVANRFLDADTAWAAAHVDEDWNISRWGADKEAAERRHLRWLEMQAAAALFAASQSGV